MRKNTVKRAEEGVCLKCDGKETHKELTEQNCSEMIIKSYMEQSVRRETVAPGCLRRDTAKLIRTELAVNGDGLIVVPSYSLEA